MSKYIDQHLETDEIVEYRAKINGWIFLIPTIIALFFIFIGTSNPRAAGLMYFIASCWILYPCIINTSTELAITNKRLIGRTRFISSKFLRLNFEQVKTVKLSQSALGKALNYGSIIIYDGDYVRYKFRFISNPIAFKTFISEKNVQISNENINI